MSDPGALLPSATRIARRAFLGRSTLFAMGPLVHAILQHNSTQTSGKRDAARDLELPHFPPRAKRVIFLTQSGGPSQLELFDPKPHLAELAGTELPESVRGGQRVTGMTKGKPQLVLPGRTKFSLGGFAGDRVSEWLPHTASIAEKICIVQSMVTDQINHAPAMTKFLTGHQLPGRPSMGSWGRLRSRNGEPRPSGLSRVDLANGTRKRPTAVRPLLGERLPAVRPPGCALAQRQGTRVVSGRPARSPATPSPCDARWHRRDQCDAPRHDG